MKGVLFLCFTEEKQHREAERKTIDNKEKRLYLRVDSRTLPMKNETVNLYALGYKRLETYAVAALFVVGNILLPQLCHLMPQGGAKWLPIYFFTLIGAYKYGWKTGLLVAVVSPVVNAVCFGMPAMASLPAILLKSVLLAMAAGYTAQRFNKVSLLLLAGVVLFYQVFGTLGEWAMKGDFYAAAQDFRLGIGGMLVQVFGGWFVIKFLMRK